MSASHVRPRTSSHGDGPRNPLMDSKAPPDSAAVHISESSDAGHRSWKSFIELIGCSLGILVCYFYFGIMQEKVTKSKYGEDGEKFTYTQALVFVQCLVNGLFALIMIQIVGRQEDTTPARLYALCSFSYVAAMISSNHALQFIPYPTQVLGKSCKPIPIMIFGVVFARRRYPIKKYLFVSLIVIGVCLFLFKEQKGGASSMVQFGWGEALLLVSLGMDGTTGAVQERIRANYKMVSHNIMLNMNMWSSLYLSFGLLVTGELFEFIGFVNKYPFVLTNLFGLSLASAAGQFFIFKTIELFGPLPCSIVTTTRKFFTILMSVLYFGNPLTQRQWLGTALVFMGLGLDSAFGKTKHPPKHDK